MYNLVLSPISTDDLIERVAFRTAEILKASKKEKETHQEPSEQFFNVQQTAKFLGLTSATIYSKVSRSELPVMKRNGRLYFSKLELLAYLKKGKVNHQDSINNDIDELLSNNKKGLRNGK